MLGFLSGRSDEPDEPDVEADVAAEGTPVTGAAAPAPAAANGVPPATTA